MCINRCEIAIFTGGSPKVGGVKNNSKPKDYSVNE